MSASERKQVRRTYLRRTANSIISHSESCDGFAKQTKPRRYAVKRKKTDIIVFVVVIAAALIIQGLILIYTNSKEVNYVAIRHDGNEIAKYKIDENKEYDFKDGEYENHIVIKDGQVYMESANCRDHICVKQGKIDKAGQTIVCLPHKLVVEIQE